MRNLRFDTRFPMEESRRDFLRSAIAAGAAALLSGSHAVAEPTSLLQKRIPSSGEMIPIIGMGTARRYEQIRTDTEKIPLRETILAFKEAGLKVIDTSPSY